MSESYIVIAFIVLLFAQQAFFMWQVQTLVNKAMSGSYQAYTAANEIKTENEIKLHKIQLGEPGEDLSRVF